MTGIKRKIAVACDDENIQSSYNVYCMIVQQLLCLRIYKFFCLVMGAAYFYKYLSNFSAVCEISDSRAGYMPELSYGSHMFQDLVEAEIIYGAIFNNEKTVEYNPELFYEIPDIFSKICPEYPELVQIVQVREVENCYFWLDSVSNHGICGKKNIDT